MIIKRPLTKEQKKILADKSKPSQEEILAAQEQLFNYFNEKILELEKERDQS